MMKLQENLNQIKNTGWPFLIEETYPAIISLTCQLEQITAFLSDGRVISIPTAWFTRLRKANIAQLNNFAIAFDGYDVHWPELDEDISVKAFIKGLNN